MMITAKSRYAESKLFLLIDCNYRLYKLLMRINDNK